MNTSLLICGADEPIRSDEARVLASNNSNPEDIIFLEAFANGGVEETRNFIAKLAKKPYSSKALTGVILEANNLTIESQNALLKSLEEPNPTTNIILTAESEFSVLATISSRCQKKYLSSGQNLKTEEFKDILFASLSEKFDLSENLNLRDWIKFIRLVVRDVISTQKASAEELAKLVKYIRLIERVASSKQIANKKLSGYVAVINIPNELKDLAS